MLELQVQYIMYSDIGFFVCLVFSNYYTQRFLFLNKLK